MTNFTVLTDEQAAHDAATSKRYIEALREVQAENARLRAHIKEAADRFDANLSNYKLLFGRPAPVTHPHRELRDWHLAALGETK